MVTDSMEPMETDAAIVRRAIDGDERAMRLLWNQHAPHVDAIVRRLAGDPDLAQDSAQEVWIQIFRALPSWRGDAKFSTWVHRVAVNRTLNALRRTRRVAAAETGIEDDSVSVEQDGERSMLAATIEEAANKVSAKDPDELIDDTREFVRKSPGVALAGAAIVGFALVRLVKSGLDQGKRDKS